MPTKAHGETPVEGAVRPLGSHWSAAWLGEGTRQALLFPSLRVFAPLRVYGRENVSGNGPYIFAANHGSHLDTPLLLAALPLRLRVRVRVAAAADYFFTSHWKGALVNMLVNAFPFNRTGTERLASLDLTQQLLSAGYSVVLFPEGTRTSDGRMQRFKWGVGWLAVNSPAQVVPTWIEGTTCILPKGSRWPRRQQVVITFGAPMQFPSDDDPERVAAEIEQRVRTLAV